MDAPSLAPLDLPVDEGDAETRVRGPWLERIVGAILSRDPRRRIRTTQWLISVLVYLGSTLVLWFGMRQGWMYVDFLVGWCVFLATGLTAVYVALRTGWSERFADPALTSPQIVLGVLAVDWGYLICGPVRSVALMPLLLIFTFGAFSLSWRRMMWLTAFALASLVACVVALHALRFGGDSWAGDESELRLDLTNVLMIMILLPALSLVATRLSALRYRLRSQRAALTEALEEVQRLATHDELTGLANRRHMQERLAQEQCRFERQQHPFSIALIDLDHFKHVNDALGHAGGDAVLRAFATEAVAMLRTSDLMARWGGEEFLLLLPDTRGPQARASLVRLLERVHALPQSTGVMLSFSAGVTEYRQGEAVADTIARADREMYEAKKAGRSKVKLQ